MDCFDSRHAESVPAAEPVQLAVINIFILFTHECGGADSSSASCQHSVLSSLLT